MLRIRYRLGLALVLLPFAVAAEQRLTSSYRDYTIRLAHWRPEGVQTAGVLLPVRINHSRTFRLVLDTGASGITLGRRAARSLGLEAQGQMEMAGVGGMRQVQTAVARTIQVGEVELADCAVRVTSDDLTRGADGVVGLNLFQDFRIRLDAGARELRLEAFPDR